MKKFYVFILLTISSVSCYSQKLISGSFELPESEKYLAVDWDFSKTVFEKKFNEIEWTAINGEKEWEDAKSEALAFILVEMCGKMDKASIIAIKTGSNFTSNYTLYICPIRLNKKGDNVSLYVLKENSTGKECGVCRITGDGGSHGTLGNLLGDGFEEAARKMGKYLKSCNRQK